MSRESVKQQVKEAFPQCTEVAEQFRAAFGDGVKLAYAEEGGQKAGRKFDESRFKVIAGKDLIVNPPKKDKHGR